MNSKLSIITSFKTALLMITIFIFITGIIYPLLVTGIAQIFFPWQANGSLVKRNGQLIGSVLIGQFFSEQGYFWGRPSMTQPFPYNSASSSGSNLSSTNPFFLAIVKNRIKQLQETSHLAPTVLIPIDLVTASGSGLDPDISPAAAFYQISRIANARHISEESVRSLIMHFKKDRWLGFLGEPRINILELNLALDNLRTLNNGQTPKS